MNNKRKELGLRAVALIAICMLAYYISNNWFQLMLIQGNSMYPTYHNLQFTIINRIDRDYQIGDVIAFRNDALKAVLVKRIVACPEDSVLIKNGCLYVNGTVSDLYTEGQPFEYAGIASSKIELKENEFFVIGDNISESKDSRYEEIGVIKSEDIIGKLLNIRH